MRYALAVAFAIAAAPVPAVSQPGTPSLVEACSSVEAETCMLKPETRICALDGKSCRHIGTDNYVAVRKVMGARIQVETSTGLALAPLSGLVTLRP